MQDIKQQVGQMLKEARKAQGLTQEEFGSKLGISKAAYNRYEKGQQNLTLETLSRIGQVLSKKLIIQYQ